jgi:hypothetical protein
MCLLPKTKIYHLRSLSQIRIYFHTYLLMTRTRYLSIIFLCIDPHRSSLILLPSLLLVSGKRKRNKLEKNGGDVGQGECPLPRWARVSDERCYLIEVLRAPLCPRFTTLAIGLTKYEYCNLSYSHIPYSHILYKPSCFNIISHYHL